MHQFGPAPSHAYDHGSACQLNHANTQASRNKTLVLGTAADPLPLIISPILAGWRFLINLMQEKCVTGYVEMFLSLSVWIGVA